MPLTIQEIKGDTAKAVQRLQTDVQQGVPSIAFEVVDVTFDAVANVDTIIQTSLRPTNPEDVLFQLVELTFLTAPASMPCIYKDGSTTRKPWNTGYIVLRSNVASVKCKLLLTVQR